MNLIFAKIHASLFGNRILAVPDELSTRKLSGIEGDTNEEPGPTLAKESLNTISYYEDFPGL